MAALFGYNLIKQQVVVENPYYLYSALKYQSEEDLKKAFDQAIAGKKLARLNENILEAAKRQDLSFFKTLQAQQLQQYALGLQALKKAAYIKGNYKTYFNQEKKLSKLEVLDLSLTQAGVKLLEALHIKKTLDDESLFKEFVKKAKDRLDVISPMTVMKATLIGFFDGIQDECSIVRFLDFDFKKPGDVIFDVYTGKIHIKNEIGFKAFMKRHKDEQLHQMMKHFSKDTIIHMTEAKLVMRLLREHDLLGLRDYMMDHQVLHHVLYLADHDYIRVDFEIIPKGKLLELSIHDFKVTKKGEEYIKHPALVKMKSRHVDRKMVMVLRALALKGLNPINIKQSGLDDLIHSPEVH